MRLRPAFLLAVPLSFLLAVPTYAAIAGTVINADGQAISGVTVSAFVPETVEARRMRYVSKSPQRVPLATTTTDSNGRFSIDDNKQAVIDLRFEAKGFAPQSSRYLMGEDAGAIALVPAPTKSGTITAQGKPLAGATVIWGGDTEFITTTDANGKFSAPDPGKWSQRLLVFHPDYALLDEVIGPFNDKKSLDRTLDKGVAIKGKVVAADGTTAVPKIAIFADNWPLATSGDDGSFVIDHVHKDWAQVEARSGDRAGARARANGDLTLRLSKAGTLAGVVRDLTTQQPLAGAEIRLVTGTAGNAVISRVAFSDVKGNYTLTPVVAGMYQLTAVRPNSTMPPGSVALTAGQQLLKPVYLTERARVSGSVLDEDKRPVAGARVTVHPAGREGGMMMLGRQGPAASAVSGPDGHFAMRGAETATDLVLEAQKRGLPMAKSSTMKLNIGDRKTGVIITIPRGLTLSGKVLDHDKRPLSGVVVDANEASNDMGAVMTRRIMVSLGRASGDDQLVRTSSDGSFSMKLKEGTYDINFKREGFSAKNVRGQAVNATTKPLEVVLDPGVEITGRVTRGGAPVEGVNVTAVSQDGLANAQSLPDGSFRIGDLTPGMMMLSVNKQESMIQTMRNVTAPAHDVAIELPAGGRISGRVVDKATHQPVTNFQAGVSMPRGGGGMVVAMPPMMRVFTSDDGTFTLDNVPTGQVELIVNAPSYTAGRVPGLNVEDGKNLENIEVGLDAGVKLTGRVTGPDGAPLSGVTVRPDMAAAGGRVMRANFGPSGESSAVTDPNGEYTLDSLEPGEKTLNFNRSGYLQEQKTVTLSGKETRLDVQLSTGMRVSGSVTTDAGAPVSDAAVSVSSSATEIFGGRNVHTDANGSFQFEGLAPGHYTFTATKSGYANGISRDVDISSGAPVRVVMKGGGVISGHVTGLTDRELTEAIVQATGANGSSSAPIDASGNFRMEGSPTGTVRVSARTGQFFGAGSKSSPVKTVEVESGGSVSVDLEFMTSTVIRGRVTRNGKMLTNAVVAFIPKNGMASTNANGTTDANGQYEVNGLDNATYTVQVVDMERITPYTTAYQVNGSGNFDIDYSTASVRGRVLDASSGDPVSDAHVELKASGSQSFFSARGAQTDGAGNFLIDNVARGSYAATAEKSGYGNETKDFSVSDSDVQLEIKIAASNGVTLRVVDARDQRLLSAMVRTIDAQGHEQDPPLLRPGAAQPITLSLAPGNYTAIITAAGYATRTLQISSPSSQTVAMSPGGTVVIHSKSGDPHRGRLIDTMTGALYTRGPFNQPIFPIDPSPGATPLMNVMPGTYRLEVMEEKTDKIVGTTSVTVVEGQQVDVAI